MLPRIPSLVLALALVVQGAHAFKFTHNDLSECGQATVSWEGGSPPFRLLIIPPGGTLRDFSIPDANFVGSRGTFSTQIAFSAGQRMLLAMSDATGVTAGGISEVLTVAPAQGGAVCSTVDPGADFFYSLDSPLRQCVDYPFTGYGRAIQPVTIFGFIPNGESFSMQAPLGDSFAWKAALPAGTTVAFYMTDAQGRNGGTSDIMTVGSTGDTSCLLRSSYSSSASRTPTGSSSSIRPTGSSAGNGQSDEKEQKKEGGSKIGIIVGAAAGGFVVLGILAFIIVFCFKRKKNQGPVQEVKLNDPTKPIPLPSSPSNTYLLPSSYNSSSTNLAPNQSAAPYAQHNQTSYTASPLSQPPAGLNTSDYNQSEYNPYGGTNESGAYGAYSSQGGSTTPSNGGASYGSPSVSGYQSSNVGSAGVAGAGVAAYGYNNYNQYQQSQQSYQKGYQQGYPQGQIQQGSQQYQQGYQQYQQDSQQHQQYYHPGYANSSSYAPSNQGSLYVTNADTRSSSYSTPSSQTTTYPPAASKVHEKSNLPLSTAPQRLIVHQDIDEPVDLPDELPPQYSEHHEPISGLPSSTAPLRDRKG